jgi:hypothetical protein
MVGIDVNRDFFSLYDKNPTTYSLPSQTKKKKEK